MDKELSYHLRELSSFKLEFMDEDDNYHRTDSYIKKLEENCLFIELPKNENKCYKIPNGSNINMLFTREDGIFIASCKVIESETDFDPILKLNYPHKTDIMERRSYVRVPLKLKTEVICYLDEDYSEAAVQSVVTRNISGNGLCYVHKEAIKKPHHDIQCQIFLHDNETRPVVVTCKHVHSKKVKIKGEIAYLTALKYTAISDQDTTRLVKECFKFQINRKKHLE